MNGPAGSQIILNDTGGVTLNSASILLTGGLTPSDVVFNITGTSPFATSGPGSVAEGIFLAPNAQIHLTPRAATGEIIAGDNINIADGGSVQGIGGGQVVPAPEIGHSAFLLLGGFPLAWWLRRGRRDRTRHASATAHSTR